MIKYSIVFFPRDCIHFGAFLFLILLKPKRLETIFKAKHKDMISNHIFKKEIR